MGGVLFFITLFTQFTPHNPLWAAPVGPSYLSINFSKLNGVTIGSSVLAKGELVGSVEKIIPISRNEFTFSDNISEMQNAGAFIVDVKIESGLGFALRKGTIALIASPLKSDNSKSEPVVELIPPQGSTDTILNYQLLGEGEEILGFASFKDFWSGAK